MYLAIVGTGYVGLVTGACFAELGHQVACLDIDAAKIAMLERGQVPFFEAGLPDLVHKHLAGARLRFTTDMAVALQEAEAVFLCVGTPAAADGGADLSMLVAAAEAVGRSMTHPLIIVQKSTAPVGTVQRLQAVVQSQLKARGLEIPFAVVCNPEFLREGSAVDDFLQPDRAVVGGADEQAVATIARLYEPLLAPERILRMDAKSAEMAKYATNAFLATKISFINEIANLCESLGADVESVRRAMGADQRIGPLFLSPGVGYGGSCFPKDVQSLIHQGQEAGSPLQILGAVDRVNQMQRQRLVQRISRSLTGNDEALLSGRRIAVWGLSFKPGTDDLREAPSLTVISELIQRGAQVQVYDPVAMDAARQIFDGTVEYAADAYACAVAAEALVLLTEWPEFAQLDLHRVRSLMAADAHLFDGRNAIDPEAAEECRFNYHPVGRPSVTTRAVNMAGD